MDNVRFPLAAVQQVAPHAIVLEMDNGHNGKALIKYASQNMEFVSGQTISSRAVAPFVKSLSEFWIQLDPQSVSVIKERIDEYILDPQFVNQKDFSATVGKPCLAFFPVDGLWYRAVVEAVEGDSVTVLYVDYGNTCNLQISYLRELPLDFINLPPLAFKCCLDGDFFKDFDLHLSALIVTFPSFCVTYRKTVNQKLFVEIGLSSDDNCFIERLIQRNPMCDGIRENHFVPGVIVQGTVSARSSDTVWIQKHPQRLEQFEEELQDASMAKDVPKRIGQPCLVQYPMFNDSSADGRWHRSIIYQVKEDEQLEVFLLDYGLKIYADVSDLREMPDTAFASPFASECLLIQEITEENVRSSAVGITDENDSFYPGQEVEVIVVNVVDGIPRVHICSGSTIEEALEEPVLGSSKDYVFEE